MNANTCLTEIPSSTLYILLLLPSLSVSADLEGYVRTNTNK